MDSQQYEGLRASTQKCMLGVAQIFAERSTCSRLRVGAVVTNAEMTQIDAIGYNGGARGLDNECESLEPGKCGHIHAEENALIKANYNLQNKKMFITILPCKQCAKLIINAGISEVYFGDFYRDRHSLVLLHMAGVKVYKVDYDKDDIHEMVEISPDGKEVSWKLI